MEMIIWAISSIVVLMLIISFLPIGYTLKGKFILVLTSFILSLGGLAAVSIFPLWQASLMLLALIFFVAYFINNRLGNLFFQENPVFGERIDEGFEINESVYEIESLKSFDLRDINEELVLPETASINLEKDPGIELIPSPEMANDEEVTENELEIIDEDISFLLERNTEVEVYQQTEDTDSVIGYLSDIESLLELDSEQEDLHELSPGLVEDNRKFDEKEEESHDNSLFDFLLTQKEVAAEREDILDKIEPKEKVSLQK